jgi:hypothetical protein
MARIFVGIDPGKSGAISILNPNKVEAFYTPMRVTRKKLKAKTKSGKQKVQVTTRYGVHLMYLLLTRMIQARKKGHEVLVALEKQSCRPNDSKAVIAQVADGYAVWRTLLELANLPFVEIQPSVWKPKYVESGSVKSVSQRACKKLYPTLDLSLAKSEALAEAVLIADYLRRKTLQLKYPEVTRMLPLERAQSDKRKKQRGEGVQRHEAKVAARVGKSKRRISPLVKSVVSMSGLLPAKKPRR